ncbi:MAG: phospho-N-acetylmuramoyl-pentapeptide-transferase [Proteobacteria bacterium]|nr:phospho-N-acetylmuramoyl-pentapeptide-transferase [Pseudomonadota bacterium]
MLYHLLLPLSDSLPGANVFRYISFRTAWGVITALTVTYLIYPWFIRWMKRQKMNQIIRDDGPESHLLGKVGTPTMGGLPLIFGVALSGLLWARLDVPQPWILIGAMVGYALIGFVDDWKKVMHASADGLSGRYKILGQLAVGAVAVGAALYTGAIDAKLAIPFLKDGTLDFAELWAGAPDLTVLYVGFCLFLLVAISNGVNLTDGLDGLAIGPVMTSAATYGVIAYVAGNARFADYLEIAFVPGSGELTILAMATVGAGLGFLWYNAYPASIFMGDVGSLSLGGTLGMFAILTKHEILLALVGGIFVLENVSVILQVASFKTRGKRVFLMAPIHHHYEKLGWSEPKIIVRFWIISIVLALVALSTLKLR